MTNDLISRSELIKRFRAIARAQANARVFIAADAWEGAACELEKAPSIDAAPVVHAEWDHWGGDEWQCTNCAEFVHTEGSWERPWQKYCPQCGARMDKEADNAQE